MALLSPLRRLLSGAAPSSRPSPVPAAPPSHVSSARRDGGAALSGVGRGCGPVFELTAPLPDPYERGRLWAFPFERTPGPGPERDPAAALALAAIHAGAATLLVATLPWRLAAAHWPEI